MQKGLDRNWPRSRGRPWLTSRGRPWLTRVSGHPARKGHAHSTIRHTATAGFVCLLPRKNIHASEPDSLHHRHRIWVLTKQISSGYARLSRSPLGEITVSGWDCECDLDQERKERERGGESFRQCLDKCERENQIRQELMVLSFFVCVWV